MGTFFKEQLHLKEPFQTFKSLTPIQHTTRTDRMKFLLPILLISLAALCNIQPAAAQEIAQGEAQEEAQGEAPVDEIDDEQLMDEMDQWIEEMLEQEDDESFDDESSSSDDESSSSDVTMRRYRNPRQRVALKKWAAFFRIADTNRTGALTWGEFWRAFVKINLKKGYSYATIYRYKSRVLRSFKILDKNHNGLISKREIVRYVAAHVH